MVELERQYPTFCDVNRALLHVQCHRSQVLDIYSRLQLSITICTLYLSQLTYYHQLLPVREETQTCTLQLWKNPPITHTTGARKYRKMPYLAILRKVDQSINQSINQRINLNQYKCKKLQFIHKLTASDTSKTAKITKR